MTGIGEDGVRRNSSQFAINPTFSSWEKERTSPAPGGTQAHLANPGAAWREGGGLRGGGAVHVEAAFAHALEFVDQSAAADAQSPGGGGAVEILLAQGLKNGLVFDFLQVVDGGLVHVDRGAGDGTDAGGKVLGHDEFAAGKKGGALHGVAEFADVARP